MCWTCEEVVVVEAMYPSYLGDRRSSQGGDMSFQVVIIKTLASVGHIQLLIISDRCCVGGATTTSRFVQSVTPNEVCLVDTPLSTHYF